VTAAQPGSEHLPISVCMLTLNEADRLQQSLPPLDAFSELIIFDSGSQDRTLELCQAVGATIHTVAWEGFGTTRRKLFEQAQCSWVLWLDADEVITPELLDELRQLFAKGPDKAAYAINRMVHFEGKWIAHGDWFPDWNVRLFRSDVWAMADVAVHESLTICGEVGQLQGLLKHYTYRDWRDQRQRSERYARLWAEQKKAQGKQVKFAEKYGRAAWRFCKGYLLKRGFLDGSIGLRIALANAREVFMKYELLDSAKK